jgi:hypothetical protein
MTAITDYSSKNETPLYKRHYKNDAGAKKNMNPEKLQ